MAGGTVLIAYDGSPGAANAITVAGSLFQAHDAIVVSVWSPVPVETVAYGAAVTGDFSPTAPAYFSDLEPTLERQAAETAEQGARIAREAGLEAEPRTAAAGDAWRGVIETAEAVDAAAIVVGARGLSGLKSALLGSTSNAVLHHTKRPVLVVQQPEA
jgi:nucleotide-binding universal stress UspA family protein